MASLISFAICCIALLLTSYVNCDSLKFQSEKQHKRPGDVDGLPEHVDGEGHHEDDYDHDAVLGSHKDAEEYKELPPEEAKKRLGVLVGKMDTDKDGSLSRDELTKWIIKSFRLLDTEDARSKMEEHDPNEDKKVTWAEFVKKAYGYSLEEVANFLKDKSEDMKSLVKMINDDKKKFDLADANSDGTLNLEEYTAFTHPHNEDRMAPVEVSKTMEDYDKNNDGVLDIIEYLGHDKMDNETETQEREHFKGYDKNKDGKLDEAEVKAWVMPGFEATAKQETDHLFKETDTNHDDKLSKDEISDKHELWVGSQATDYGKHLEDMHKDEL